MYNNNTALFGLEPLVNIIYIIYKYVLRNYIMVGIQTTEWFNKHAQSPFFLLFMNASTYTDCWNF